MSEIKGALERIERRVAMPEPAKERMLRRRERHERNERIAAAVVGLGVAAAGIAGAVLTLRVAGGTRPASGQEPPAAEGGGLLLPTVAIWTAIAVLALTAFAAARLRARFAEVDAEAEREAREPGGAAASARRPAADPETVPRKGGTEMDSKPKTDVTRIPGAERPEIRFDDGKLRRTNRWLIGAVVVLAVAVVALGVALIASSGEEPVRTTRTSTVGLADPSTVAMIDAMTEAMSTDGERFASFFTEDGVMDEVTAGEVTRGREDIAAHVQEFIDRYGFHTERIGPVIQSGRYVATSATATGLGTVSGIIVYELTPDGQVSRQWGIVG